MRIFMLTIASLALGLSTGALAATPTRVLPEDGFFQTAVKLTGLVHVLAQVEPFHPQPAGNVTIIEQTDGFVLVDAGGSPGDGRRIVAMVKAIGPKPVKAVIVTHWHGDHHFGLPAIVRAWPKAVVISTHKARQDIPIQKLPLAPSAKEDAETQANFAKSIAKYKALAADPNLPTPMLRGYASLQRELAQYADDLAGAYQVLPGVTFTDRLDLHDDLAPVEVLFLGRANTDGDAIVWLPKQKVLVTGDAVVAPVPYGGGSYPADWLKVLDRLRAYDFAFLVPGHGRPQTDRAYLDKLTVALTDVRAQAAALAARKRSKEQTFAELNFDTPAKVFAAGDPWKRRYFDIYWAKWISDSAYKEANGLEIRQDE